MGAAGRWLLRAPRARAHGVVVVDRRRPPERGVARTLIPSSCSDATAAAPSAAPPDGSLMERDLWLVMTAYALRTDPTTPERLSALAFTRLCVDSGLVDERHVVSADARIAFTSQLTKSAPSPRAAGGVSSSTPSRVAGPSSVTCKTLDFPNFLEALRRVAVLAKRADGRDAAEADRAFIDAVERNVLPLAARRRASDVSRVLETDAAAVLAVEFRSSLSELFRFYASPAAAAPGTLTRSAARTGTGTGGAAAGAAGGPDSIALTVEGFLRFARDFNLSGISFSLVDAADAFLCVLRGPESRGVVVGYAAIWECLVRCALHAFAGLALAPDLDKLKAFLCHLWRTLQESSRSVEERRYKTSFAGDLVSAAAGFNAKFTAMWMADGLRDYTAPVPAPVVSALRVLKRADADAAAAAAAATPAAYDDDGGRDAGGSG